MASLIELAASETELGGGGLAHLQRLVGSWGLLADLCFADLLLYVPTSEGDGFVVLSQVRPTTSQTLYREDQVGKVVSRASRPLVARAWELGAIIDGDSTVSARGEIARVQCIPVRWKEGLLGVMTRESAPSVGRRQGELERVYMEIFDRFARMISAGEFPFAVENAEPDEAPRVGDGLALLDAAARVVYASPNFVSILHRMRVHGNTSGARLSELGVEESAVRAAFAIGLGMTEEIERGDVNVLLRCIPLLERGQATGAVLIVRDVSDLRRRDRLLISKDATIREIHHRVKNNLQTISSLLRLHARRVESEEARKEIEESVRRIRSIALVHERLSGGATQELAFDEVVRGLVRMVEEGLQSPERPVRFQVEGEAGELRAEVATPLSVVLTELLQNAVEHGYPDGDGHDGPARRGRVVVSLANDGRELTVRVHDDGVGLPEGFSFEEDASLGLTIVRTLVATELRGSMTMKTDGGTLVEVRVPVIAGRESLAPGEPQEGEA